MDRRSRNHALTRWFARQRRPLPWRTDRTAYRIWVAEVLLQQTRVAQAVPYYLRFFARFPDVAALARASTEGVLKTWEGAGYYARARSLHAAARQIVAEHGGKLPTTRAELARLPGFGPYISAAVASLAFGERVPALEANGIRVLARWSLERGDPRRAEVRRRLERELLEALPTEDPGAFNEAVMELGETICTPRRPACPACPVARYCRAHLELPDPSIVPPRRPRPARPNVVASIVAVESAGRWFVQRRSESGLLRGLWEFPGGKPAPGETLRDAARRELREETGLIVGALAPVGTVRHGYSHFTVQLHLFRGRLRGRRPKIDDPDEQRWVTPEEFEQLPRPRATVKAVELLGPPRPKRASPG